MDTLNSDDFLQYVSSYEPTGRVIEHPTLGEFTQLENDKRHRILRKIIPSGTLAKVDIAIFEQYRTLPYNRVVKLLGITENLEGGHEGYAAYYEHFQETLKDEIERKAEEGTKYTELEILKILQNIASSLSYMMSVKVYHGEIKSINVVKVGQEYKVLNPVLFGKFTQLVKDDRPRLPKFYTKIVTPEVRHAVYRDILDPVHETYKDDVFGLGMIALDLMTLKVDPSIPIEKRLEKSNFLFSNDLVRFVKKALERVVSLRLDPVACCSYLERIQMQHGLVSVQRFSKRGRNYSVLPRETTIGGSMLAEDSEIETSVPALRKMPSRENNYNRRTESVIPNRMSEDPEPVELRMNETSRSSVANYETPVYAKKIGDYGGRDSIRHSTASTAFSTEQRVTRWEVFRETNRFSMFDTPRTSDVDGINTEKLDGEGSIKNSVNIPCVTSTREFVGAGEYRFDEGRPSENLISPSLSSILNIPVSNYAFTTPPRTTVPLDSVQNSFGGLDNLINVKYVQSELGTPQTGSNRFDAGSEQFGFSRSGTGVSDLRESKYVVEPCIQTIQETKQPSYSELNKERTEHTTRSAYVPQEVKTTPQTQKPLVVSTAEDHVTMANRVSPKFMDSEKDGIKFDFKAVNESLSRAPQQTICLDSRVQTNSFLVSMNDILPNDLPRSTQETNDDVDYIEDEPSIDQTFSEPVAEVQEMVKPEQKSLMSRYSVPNTYSTASLATDYSMTRGDTSIQLERKTLAPQTFSSSSLQQDYKYYTPYQPRQSYDTSLSQSKMTKKTVETLSDGTVYEGEVLGYMKQGKGKLTYPDGKYFEGDWKVGQINGQGKLCAANGSVIYDGQWQDAKFHGRGTHYNLSPIRPGWVDSTQGLKVSSKEEGMWVKYNGSLRNNSWEGFGELYLANGDKYVGEFKRDAANGKGKYLSAGGKEWEGQWVNNSLVQS